MEKRSVGQRVFETEMGVCVGIVDKTGKWKMREKWEFELNETRRRKARGMKEVSVQREHTCDSEQREREERETRLLANASN